MPKATAKLIQMPNRLKDRVSDTGDDLSFEEILDKSALIISRLSGDWRVGALHATAELTLLTAAMHAEPLAMGPLLPSFFFLAHGVQSQAGVFGYGEVGQVASEICEYLAGLDAEGGNLGDPRRHLAVFDRHLARLRRLLIDDVRDAPVDFRQAG
ncbi:MAG: hypothetical protein EXQ95_14760 [Alphaproteobacteria bacterium]|nr:hypothetical protein [Alphaproteobacteria bacterium]